MPPLAEVLEPPRKSRRGANLIPGTKTQLDRIRPAAIAASRQSLARRKLEAAAKAPGETAPRLSSIAAARIIADLAERVARLEQRVRELENPPALSRDEYIARRTEDLCGPAIVPPPHLRKRLALSRRRPAEPRAATPAGDVPLPLRAAGGTPPAAPTVPTGSGGAPALPPRPDQ